MTDEELQERRKAMFYENFDNNTICRECGCVIAEKDAHFGFHLKIDNIDQRVVQHSHPHSHPEPGREP